MTGPCLQDTHACGVGAAYTATLPSTAAILQALREAYIFQQGILSVQVPSQQWAAPAPTSLLHTNQHVRVAQPSPNSKLCGVVGCSCRLDPEQYLDEWLHTLFIYDTKSGKLLHHLHSVAAASYSIAWSPCSTFLRVHYGAQQYGEGHQIDVWEAETGHNVTPTWTKEAAEAVESSSSDFTWAPDESRWLGVDDNDSVINATRLHVVDLFTGKLVESVQIARRYCRFMNADGQLALCIRCAIWHPSSRGFITSQCSCELLSPQVPQAAGLVTGLCPLPAHLRRDSSFSPCGRLLIAGNTLDSAQAGNLCVILQCAQQDCQYSLTILHSLDVGLLPVWFPFSGVSDALLLRSCKRLVTCRGEALSSLGLPEVVLHGAIPPVGITGSRVVGMR